MKRKIRITAIFALAMTAALLPGGCRSDTEAVSEPAETPASIDLALDVHVLSPGSATPRKSVSRAADPDAYEPAAYPEEELRHLRVIIVDSKTGAVVHNRGILFDSGVSVADDMRFKVLSSTSYRIYLLGNAQEIVGDIVMNDGFNPTVLQSMELSAEPGNPLYDNTGTSKTYIPMSEIFDVETPVSDGTSDQEYKAELFITRAASKFSFAVRTTEDFTGSGASLTSVKISGIGSREFLFPRNAVYNPEKYLPSNNKLQGREIVKFDVPYNTETTDFIYTFPTPVSLPTDGYTWTPRIYLPETAFPAGGHFMCTLSFDNGESWLVPAVLPNLPYGLPRNTHAVVTITLSDKNMALLQVNVLPWESEINDFEYSDQIGIAADGAITFTPGTYLSLDKSTARLVLDYPEAATGSFGIASPVGAYWDAYLVTISGEQDAIRFRQPDGTLTGHIRGIVGPRKAEFAITAPNAPGATANTAVLQVTVTMADGRTLPANVLQGGGYGSGCDKITIIQNPQ